MGLSYLGQLRTGIASLDTSYQDIRSIWEDGGWSFYATSGVAGGITAWRLDAAGRMFATDTLRFSISQSAAALPRLSLVDMPDGTRGLWVIGQGGAAPGIVALPGSGRIGSTFDPGRLPYDMGRMAVVLQMGADSFLVSDQLSGGVSVLRQDPLGFMCESRLFDDQTTHLAQVVALQDVHVGNMDYILALDRGEYGVTVLTRTDDGVAAVGQFGAVDGLGLMVPTDMEVVSVSGRSFVIVASSAGGAGALSVLELDASGQLIPRDHVLDNLHTRFGAVQCLATAEIEGRHYVLAGGGDDGLALFAVLPDGMLVHLESLPDSVRTGLQDISALSMVAAGGALRILAAGQDMPGLSMFSFEPDLRGTVIEGRGNIAGTAYGDWIVGSSENDTISAGHGNDLIHDGHGSDILRGGGGADLFIFAHDRQRDVIMDFDPATDRLDLSAFPQLYDPGALTIVSTDFGAIVSWRDEEIVLRSERSLSPEEVRAAIVSAPHRVFPIAPRDVTGTEGNDFISGTWAPDHIRGRGGNDTLHGGEADDWILGEAGNDRLTGGNGSDDLDGGDGNDTLTGGEGHDRLTGGAGDDTIIADAGDDVVAAGAGNDLVTGFGNDTVDLGDGDDLYDGRMNRDRASRISVVGGSGNDRMLGGLAENTFHGGNGNDIVVGGANNDTLHGNFGDDSIYSGDGNDIVTGGPGRDLIALGDGNDRFVDDNQTGWHGEDTVWAANGNDHVSGRGGDDYIHGGNGSDTLIGGTGRDRLWGDAGDDRISGGDMGDFIFAGVGNDTVQGGDGPDTAWLGSGHDVYIDTAQTGASAQDTIWAGEGNDSIWGGGGDDSIFGQSGFDRIGGGDGNDLIRGGSAPDTIWGGAGADSVWGDDGRDSIWLGDGDDVFHDNQQQGHYGADRVFGGRGDDQMNGGGGNDTLSGEAGDDRIFAGSGNDLLAGGVGADTLNGSYGDDEIYGHQGNDILIGGAGRDRFVFGAGFGHDRIRDFSAEDDIIILQGGSAADVTLRYLDEGVSLSWEQGSILLEGLSGLSLDDMTIW